MTEARQAEQLAFGSEEPRPEVAALDWSDGAVRPYDGPADPDRLLEHVGLARFREGQREAVEAALAGRDVLLVMPTGAGKSLCYQLPALASPRLSVVVSPLIALMVDQVKALRDRHQPVVMLASGMAEGVAQDALARIRDGRARAVYCSPERFASNTFAEAIAQRDVDLFVVDEAHCISEWGHDFRPDYLRLPRAIERVGRPVVIACTATATPAVAREIAARLGLREPLAVRAGFDRPNLSFDVVGFDGKGAQGRKLAVLAGGLAAPGALPAIVYCGTRADTDSVASSLRGQGLTAAAYHAGMAPAARRRAQQEFMSEAAEVVVATNAFGMGVDKANVRGVWHWALPTGLEAYYQEAGRGGRDGEQARAVLLAARHDLGRLVHFIKQKTVAPADVDEYVQRLRRAAGSNGALEIESPADDAERVQLAIAERAGACAVEPAAGGRLRVQIHGRLSHAKAVAECRVAGDRAWRAYRAIEGYAFGDRCRRRVILDHFGDRTAGRPLGRCCDVCDPDPELHRLFEESSRAASPAKGLAAAEVELAPADEPLFDALRAWRLEAAAGKPAYTVAHDSTLRLIAARQPADLDELGEIKGVGVSFLAKYGIAVLELLRRQG